MSINIDKKENFMFFHLCSLFILIFISISNSVIFGEGDILHLKKADFDDLFNRKPNTLGNFYNDMECRLWNSPFICWDKNSRAIVVPNWPIFPLSRRIIPLDVATELENFYNTIRSSRESHLVTNVDMMAISIAYLAKDKYYCVKCLKDDCTNPENKINFYIFDFTAKDNKEQMDIYYGVEENPGSLQFVTNAKSVGDPHCIREWKTFLKGKKQKTIINVEIQGLIGSETVLGISPPITNVTFSDSKNPNSTLYYKVISSVQRESIPIIKLEFDLSNESDLEMIAINGIWLNGSRIIYSSLYSMILEFFNRTGATIENSIFKLHFSRTSDFDLGKPDLNSNIQNRELPAILSFIIDIIQKRTRRTVIQLIGYADVKGKETNSVRWKNKNVELSKERAVQVKQWLEKKMGTYIHRVVFETKGCDQEYYNQHDRCVEIKIF